MNSSWLKESRCGIRRVCTLSLAVSCLLLLAVAKGEDQRKENPSTSTAASEGTAKDSTQDNTRVDQREPKSATSPSSASQKDAKSDASRAGADATDPTSLPAGSAESRRSGAREHRALRPNSEDSRAQHQGESNRSRLSRGQPDEQADEEWNQSYRRAQSRDHSRTSRYGSSDQSSKNRELDDQDEDSNWQDVSDQASEPQSGQHRRQRRDYSRDDRQHGQGQSAKSDSQEHRHGASFSKNEGGRLTVSRVAPKSQAARAGLQQGDQVVSISGRPVSSQADFQRWSRSSRRVPVVVLRDGQRFTIFWSAPAQGGYRDSQYADYDEPAQDDTSDEYAADYSEEPQAFLGVKLNEQYPSAAVVSEVYQDSPAEQAGLRRGDTIVRVNGHAVRSPHDLTQLVAQMEPGQPLRIEISRRQTQTVQARLGKRDSQVGRASYENESADEQEPSRYFREDSQYESEDDRESNDDRSQSLRSDDRSDRETGRGFRGRFFDRR